MYKYRVCDILKCSCIITWIEIDEWGHIMPNSMYRSVDAASP